MASPSTNDRRAAPRSAGRVTLTRGASLTMRPTVRTGRAFFSFALLALIGARVAAFDFPLTSDAIREAYFLGAGSPNATADFLGKYVQHLPLPKSGPHVSEIEVRTPFAQVVVSSRAHTVGYSAQQAEADYNQRRPILQVRITIHYTPTYTFQAPPPGCQGLLRTQSVQECWRDFRFTVS